MRQKKIRFYLILVSGVAIFYSFGDPIVQDKKLSPLEYIIMEEELMLHEETIPRVTVQIIASNSVDTAYVTPAETFPSQKGTWTFNYIPKIDPFALGGKVILEVPFAFLPNQKSWTYPQINSSSSPGFVKVRSSNPATNISLRLGSRRPYDFNITATFTEIPPVIGDTISFIYGDISGSLNGQATSNVHATDYDFRILTDKLGTNLWTVVTPIPSIQVVPNPAKYFKITVPSLLTTQKSVSAVIIAFDEYNNIDPGFLGSLSLSCLGGTNCGTPSSVVFDALDFGRAVISFNSGEGEHQLIAADFSGTEHLSNPFKVSTSLPEFKLFWGDIQNHSTLSDGNGTIEDFYHYARDVANLDFVALTDHDHAYNTNPLESGIWENIRDFARTHNSDGKFISFLAWEWSNERTGHKHVIYPGDEGEPYNYLFYPLIPDLWKALEGERALTISHHVAWGHRKVDWNFRNDKFQRIVEIYSQHGSFEFELNPLGPTIPRARAPGHYVRDALAMGHKMGILASSDGHFGYPGNGWMWAPTFLDTTSRATGLTGIYADTLTRESLFKALEDRRVFGTTDHRTIVEFKVNGDWMGSEIISDSLPLIEGSVFSHTPIKNLEVVKFNGIDYDIIPIDLEGINSSINFSFRDSSYVRSSFYYLRVTSVGNMNDRFAWSSPVWVSKPVLTQLVEIPSENEYGYFSESDIAYKNEIGFSFRSDNMPFTVGESISFEAYNVQNDSTISVFVNDIFLSYLDTTADNSWGTVESMSIPMRLVDTLNVVRFENRNALLNDEISEWGVRKLNISATITGISPGEPAVIRSYQLTQNYPNPFNPTTTIDYVLQTRSDISLIVFNLNGQEIARLVDEEKAAGKHSVEWDASNLPSGIYFYRLKAGNFVQTKKMVLLK